MPRLGDERCSIASHCTCDLLVWSERHLVSNDYLDVFCTLSLSIMMIKSGVAKATFVFQAQLLYAVA